MPASSVASSSLPFVFLALGLPALVLLASVGCTGMPGEPDAGPEPDTDPGTCEAGDPVVVTAGQMGVTRCEESGCAFGGASCSVDGDCFVAVPDAYSMPAWVRPQGGIGTRYNVRIDGVATGATFETLRTLLIKERTGVTCTLADCPGAGCPCDDTANETCVELPEGTQCAAVLVDQTNRVFPAECRADGAIHVEEVPVQFLIGWQLEQVDNQVFDLEVHMEIDGQLHQSEPRAVEMTVGDFIYPVSFDPCAGDGCLG